MQDKSKTLKEILFHTLDEKTTLEKLESSLDGLSEHEAEERASIYGTNELEEGKKKSIIIMFLEQFKDIMVIVLLIAALISGLTHDITDSFIILAVVVINAILGVVQESKAEKALSALKKMSSPNARVKRDGTVKQIKSESIVPGDIVLLEAGDYVPADMRLLQSASLKIEEAALTGESVPAEKITVKIDKPDLVIGDRRNMAYTGSSITYGRGMGVVMATGMETEVGKIAGHLTRSENQQTPLQRKLAELSKYLTIGIILISVIIFVAGIVQGRAYLDMFLIAISLAVAAIPEGLPAVITIVLALGVQKMAKRKAIIRKLSAVETLGSTEIICSDKTGTLTQNKMTVKEVYVGSRTKKAEELSENDGNALLFIQSLVLCNDSKQTKTGKENVEFIGDPTETALTSFGHYKGFLKDRVEEQIPRIGEIPFDSERKLMTTINRFADKQRIITKGAPDVLLERCSGIMEDDGSAEPLTDEHRKRISEANREMASKALRVLAVAVRESVELPDNLSSEVIERNLNFLGLVGMIDPPREEARDAVRICSEAGIRPIMITGDHKDTAAAIAKELNIIQSEEQVITGSELNTISDEEFKEKVKKYSVYARVSPEHKVRIVKAWKQHDKIVAMTGDGVNDAPALKAADIGIGMGITGTDVAKGVSNMVLSDDNFATIVVAVEEGRKVYSNMRKTIQFLLSSNLGEIVTLFLGTMLNWTVLLPIHILWVNLVTDTLPALALGVEAAEKDIMKKRPRKAKSGFFSEGYGISIIYQGIFKGLLTLSAFFLGLQLYTQEIATTMAFTTLGLIQLTHSLNVRSNEKSLFRIGVFSNTYLIGAIAIAAFLQLIVIVVPFFREIFKVTSLNTEQWLIVLAASFTIIPVVEAVKIVQNRRQREEV
ncbi:MAG: calcium-translocating P-type ATPase, SERCA-type [Clostridia bacterium]|nr:calcium-translocating P-type ATPase, SERCA-type [Clostridia bacterium]